ncbi:MAG TPA: HD domain-containing protein [Candidatus Saccharimonadia bacterium]|nr:HD domain-containing protein [Candidatus Saccharimonadia bacterium]
MSELYQAATTSMGQWMWRNHTQWVADKAKQLAEKYGADAEKAYCAALLHDLGDSRYERGHERFEAWSIDKGQEILVKAGFTGTETAEIMAAIRTHSCRPGNLPTAQEGRVLATADGMWHLQTSFFPIICYMNRPETTKSYEEWQAWFVGKIERDFGPKIFFEDERAEVRADYEALVRVFGKRTLEN